MWMLRCSSLTAALCMCRVAGSNYRAHVISRGGGLSGPGEPYTSWFVVTASAVLERTRVFCFWCYVCWNPGFADLQEAMSRLRPKGREIPHSGPIYVVAPSYPPDQLTPNRRLPDGGVILHVKRIHFFVVCRYSFWCKLLWVGNDGWVYFDDPDLAAPSPAHVSSFRG